MPTPNPSRTQEGSLSQCPGAFLDFEHLEAVARLDVVGVGQHDAAFEAGADLVMLDELSLDDMREAARRRDAAAGRARLEASGGVSLETIRGIAETGVDYISVGGLTKHVQAVDLSLRVEFVGVAPAN